MNHLLLLGPQRHHPHILEASQAIDIHGPWAAITAGWQEREDETEELVTHLGQPVANLRLYHRAEKIFQDDPLLREALHHHQQELIALQELYRLRLRHAMGTVHQLLKRKRPGRSLLEPEIEDSFQSVRRLDQHHLDRVQTLNQAFQEKWDLGQRASVREHRDQIAEILSQCHGVLIAGGHVAILLNRMRLFGLPDMLRDKPIIGWTAGAMVLGKKIVLFHDSPPQGRGYAEVFESGIGRYDGRLVFPSAQKRLSLQDPLRVMLLARRFSQDECWTLDAGAQIQQRDGQWHQNDSSHRLFPSGKHHLEATS